MIISDCTPFVEAGTSMLLPYFVLLQFKKSLEIPGSANVTFIAINCKFLFNGPAIHYCINWDELINWIAWCLSYLLIVNCFILQDLIDLFSDLLLQYLITATFEIGHTGEICIVKLFSHQCFTFEVYPVLQKASLATGDVFERLKHGSVIIGCWNSHWSDTRTQNNFLRPTNYPIHGVVLYKSHK